MTRPRHHTKAFMDRAVELCEAADRPIAAVARDLGLRYQTLYKWMSTAGKTKRVDVPVPAPTPRATRKAAAMQAEIDRLQLELDETKKQLEFAKKAAAFFAQQNK